MNVSRIYFIENYCVKSLLHSKAKFQYFSINFRNESSENWNKNKIVWKNFFLLNKEKNMIWKRIYRFHNESAFLFFKGSQNERGVAASNCRMAKRETVLSFLATSSKLLKTFVQMIKIHLLRSFYLAIVIWWSDQW